MNHKTLFISGALLVLLAFVMATVLYKNHQAAGQAVSAGQNQDIVERQGAPVIGPADAKVTIVEFFDPACGTCQEFYPFTKKLIDQYPGKVKVMMRYAPLHTGSDQVVKLLEAAHHQGKFWQALELLFNNQRRWIVNHTSQPNKALALVNSLDLDQDKLRAELDQPSVTSVIQQDIRDAQALGVKATPEFFVNGRPMPSFGYKQLSDLVKEAVAEAY
jgi:protein-disulfide isomerase